jgi:hypothetical protein
MSHLRLRKAWLHRRVIAAGAAACALAAIGALAVTIPAQATGPSASRSACRTATLKGTYLFAGNGWTVSHGKATPTAFAGSEHFNGAGRVAGSSTFSSDGTIFPRSAFTGTYTVSAGCTGTLTIGTTLHFDLYLARSGAMFTYVQTDPGSVSATTENRATRT